MPSTQPTCTPALCSSPQPPPPQPLGVPGAQGAGAGAHRHPRGWMRGPSAAGTAHGPAAVFPVFLSAGGRLSFRLFSSCSVAAAAAACWPPRPRTRSRVPGHPPMTSALLRRTRGLPGSWRAAALPSEPGIPVASQAVI